MSYIISIPEERPGWPYALIAASLALIWGLSSLKDMGPANDLPFILGSLLGRATFQCGLLAALMAGAASLFKARVRVRFFAFIVLANLAPALLLFAVAQMGVSRAQEIEAAIKPTVDRFAVEDRAHVATIGARPILDANVLAKDPSLKATRARLDDQRKLAADYRAQFEKRIWGLRAALKASDHTPKWKREADAAVSAEFDKGMLKTRQQWKLDDEMFTAVEHEIEFLEQHRGGWAIQDGQLMFASEPLMRDFRVLDTELRKAKTATPPP